MVILSLTPLLILFLNQLINIPGLIKYQVDVFSPQFLLAGAVLIGTTIRTYYLLYDPLGHSKMITLVGNNLPEDILMPGLLAINLGITLWMLGFTMTPKNSVPRYETSGKFDSAKYVKAQIFLVCAGLILTFLYLLRINFFSEIGTYGISGKRIEQVGTSYGNTTTYGYLRVGGDILAACTIAHALYYYTFMQTRKNRFVLFGLFLLACIVPFVASARGDILYLILGILVIRHYTKRAVSPKAMMVITVLFFFMLGAMGILRQQAYRGVDNVDVPLTESTINTLIYNAHFIGVGKTSVIIEEMPVTENYLFGKTYFLTFLAPIPRVLWPDKPVVRSGRFVGSNLYHKPTLSGVPPGVIGEAYMNFGWGGILVVMLLFGFVCKRAYLTMVVRRNPDDAYRLGLYVITMLMILDVSMTDFTGNVMRFFKFMVPFYILMRMSMVPNLTYGRSARRRIRQGRSKHIHGQAN